MISSKSPFIIVARTSINPVVSTDSIIDLPMPIPPRTERERERGKWIATHDLQCEHSSLRWKKSKKKKWQPTFDSRGTTRTFHHPFSTLYKGEQRTENSVSHSNNEQRRIFSPDGDHLQDRVRRKATQADNQLICKCTWIEFGLVKVMNDVGTSWRRWVGSSSHTCWSRSKRRLSNKPHPSRELSEDFPGRFDLEDWSKPSASGNTNKSGFPNFNTSWTYFAHSTKSTQVDFNKKWLWIHCNKFTGSSTLKPAHRFLWLERRVSHLLNWRSIPCPGKAWPKSSAATAQLRRHLRWRRPCSRRNSLPGRRPGPKLPSSSAPRSSWPDPRRTRGTLCSGSPTRSRPGSVPSPRSPRTKAGKLCSTWVWEQRVLYHGTNGETMSDVTRWWEADQSNQAEVSRHPATATFFYFGPTSLFDGIQA